SPMLHTLSLHDALPIYLPASALTLRDTASLLRNHALHTVVALLHGPQQCLCSSRGFLHTSTSADVPRTVTSQNCPSLCVVSHPRSEEHTSELQSRFDLV